MTDVSKSYRIKESRFRAQIHGFENTHWIAYIDPSVPYDEILKPDFWAHIAEPRRVKIGDDIVAVSDDGAWRAHLSVLDVGRVWLKVAELSKHQFEVQQKFGDTEHEAYRVEFKGRMHKHAVIRNTDNEIIKGGFATQVEALQWLAGHVKAMAA